MTADPPQQIHVVIVGAGIGGLSCAIACRRSDASIKVTVLERVPEILTIGAGIHIPPNATRILTEFGLLEKLKAAGAYAQDSFRLRRYYDGEVLADKPLGPRMVQEYGAEWMTIQRGDYQSVLLEAALEAGANIVTNADVADVESLEDKTQLITLKDGRRLNGDVVVGADGLWSTMRDIVCPSPSPIVPYETGAIAYRVTFTYQDVRNLQSERLDRLLEQSDTQVWLGYGKHVVFYPLRNREEFNLVFIVTEEDKNSNRASNAPETYNPVQELAANYRGWDPLLLDIISSLKPPLKWNLFHIDELEHWTKGSVALLGDACHPSLPYQGQGAAMAVEDGAVLGLLLGNLQSISNKMGIKVDQDTIADALVLYETIRKERSKDNIVGSMHTGYFYHLPDGEEQRNRDRELAELASNQWQGSCSFNWGDASYQRKLLGFDVLGNAKAKTVDWTMNAFLDE